MRDASEVFGLGAAACPAGSVPFTTEEVTIPNETEKVIPLGHKDVFLDLDQQGQPVLTNTISYERVALSHGKWALEFDEDGFGVAYETEADDGEPILLQEGVVLC